MRRFEASQKFERVITRLPLAGLFTLVGITYGGNSHADSSRENINAPGTLELTVGEPGQGVFINLTPANPDGNGYGRLHGDGPMSVLTSDVNFSIGRPIDPNVAIAAVRPDGTVTFENSPNAQVDVIADALIAVDDYVPAKKRLMDTRIEGKPMKPGETRCFAVPGDVGDGAVLNTTVVEASGPGYVTLTPGGTSLPETSTNNFFGSPGEVVSNAAVIEIGPNEYGEVCVFNSHHGTAHVIIDSSGSIDKSVYKPTPTGKPIRLVDTREGLGGNGVRPGEEVRIKYGIPGDVVILNITPLNADGPGYGVVYGSHQPMPESSNVNFEPGSVIPNMAFAVVGPDGYVIYKNSDHSHTDVAIDVSGSFRGDKVDVLNIRLADTRTVGKLQPSPQAHSRLQEIPYNPHDRLNPNANMELTKTHANVIYGPTSSYSFDVYEGANPFNGITLAYLHGGGWEGGNNSLNTGNEQLVRQLGANFGYKIVSAAYPLSGEAPYPAQYEAVDALIRHLQAHAVRYGIDPTKIVPFGHSAGGNMATNETLTTDEFKADWLPPELARQNGRVAAGVAISSPFNFDSWVLDVPPTSELSPIPGLNKLLGIAQYSGSCACYGVLNSAQYADPGDPTLIALLSGNDPLIPATAQYAELHNIAQKSPVVVFVSPIDGHNAGFGISAKTVHDLIRGAVIRGL